MSVQDLQTLLNELGERPIAYHPAYARLCGSISGGLMLSQAMYWSARTSDEHGWFWKTQAQWNDELGLTRKEIESGTRKLLATGVLETERRGIPARMYYRVNRERLASLLAGGVTQMAVEDVLRVFGATLNQISKSGLARARRYQPDAAYVDYREVLARDGMVCGICGAEIRHGPGTKRGMLNFDHIQPLATGGEHSMANLRPAHAECNQECPAGTDWDVPPGPTGMSRRDTLDRPPGTDIHTETTAESTAESTQTPASGRKRQPKPAGSDDIDFCAFYEAYPRKVGRGQAYRAWTQANPDDALVATIMEALERQIAAGKFRDPRYTPHPSTWLNGQRWLDALDQHDGWAAFLRGEDPDDDVIETTGKERA